MQKRINVVEHSDCWEVALGIDGAVREETVMRFPLSKFVQAWYYIAGLRAVHKGANYHPLSLATVAQIIGKMADAARES